MIHSKRKGIKPLDFDTPTFGRGFWLKPIDLSKDYVQFLILINSKSSCYIFLNTTKVEEFTGLQIFVKMRYFLQSAQIFFLHTRTYVY